MDDMGKDKKYNSSFYEELFFIFIYFIILKVNFFLKSRRVNLDVNIYYK